MPHYGMLHDHKLEGVNDLRAAEVYGVDDEKLGTIDDVIFDHSTGDIRYIVLKTGGLFSHKRVMVPASRLEPYGQEQEDKFYVDLDKELLKAMPEFKEEALANAAGWSALELESEKFWTENPLVNNKLTGRMITPPHEEEEGLNFAIGSNGPAVSGTKADLKPEKMGKQDDLLGVASGVSKTTLRPKKPSIGGKEDVEMIERGKREAERREVMSPAGSEIEIPRKPPASHAEESTADSMREPGVYKLDPVVESEQGAGPPERQNVDLGPRWNGFQQSLRVVRSRIVVECQRCASQDKAA